MPDSKMNIERGKKWKGKNKTQEQSNPPKFSSNNVPIIQRASNYSRVLQVANKRFECFASNLRTNYLESTESDCQYVLQEMNLNPLTIGN